MPNAYPKIDNSELITLAELAGVQASPGVFRILIELLSLQVSPEDVYTLIRQISPISNLRKSSATSSITRRKPS